MYKVDFIFMYDADGSKGLVLIFCMNTYVHTLYQKSVTYTKCASCVTTNSIVVQEQWIGVMVLFSHRMMRMVSQEAVHSVRSASVCQ